MSESKVIEWVIVGGGIAGITAAEILTRNGHQVVLIEKKEELAGETSAVFHEWMHFGSLYTLFPGLNKTLRYVLGGVDDLIEYYSCFENMNFIKSDKGIITEKEGWFSDKKITFRFKLKNRRLVIPWIIGIARSVLLIKNIKEHDWLRRKAGETKIKFTDYFRKIPNIFINVLTTKNDFYELETADNLMNSRVILNDLVSVAQKNGLIVKTNSELKAIEKLDNGYTLKYIENGSEKQLNCENLALASAKDIVNFIEANFSDSYAPIVVAKNIEQEKRSFVNLDYFPSTCVNSIYKGEGVSMLGGISFKTVEECEPYIQYIIDESKKINPSLTPIGSYIGTKTELLFKDQDRSYIYSIMQDSDLGIWTLVPGKFSLAFSMAVEFYRKVKMRNPTKSLKKNNTEDNFLKVDIGISPHRYKQIIDSNK